MIGVYIAAWGDLRSRPLRALAAVIGVLVALVALVTVITAGVLSRQGQSIYLQQVFGSPATLSLVADDPAPRVGQTFRRSVEESLAAAGVPLVSRVQTGRALIERGDGTSTATVLVVDPPYCRIHALVFVVGGCPRSKTADALAPRVLIDARLVAHLGLDPERSVGEVLQLGPAGSAAEPDVRTVPTRAIVVAGVVSPSHEEDAPSPVLLFGDPPSGMVPTQSARGLTGYTWQVRVSPHDVGYVYDIVNKVGVSWSATFQVTRLDHDDSLAPVIAQQSRTGSVLAWTTLVVGGLGLVTTSLSGARERSRELGIRRAGGATDRAIFAMVLLESLLSSLLAVALALPVCWLVVKLVPGWLIVPGVPVPTHASLPLSAALTGVLAAVAVGLAAGVLPAVRAARTSVITAIRD